MTIVRKRDELAKDLVFSLLKLRRFNVFPARRDGLSGQERLVLLYLLDQEKNFPGGYVPIAGIIHDLSLLKETVSRILTGLVFRLLISRRACPHNARCSMCRLTKKGREIAALSSYEALVAARGLLKKIGVDDAEELIRIVAGLERMDEGSGRKKECSS